MILIALFAMAQAMTPGQPIVVTPDQFVRLPTPFEYRAIYPYGGGIPASPGSVDMNCSVQPDGGLTKCRIVRGGLINRVFSAPSLALAPLFKLDPDKFKTTDSITFTLNWSLSGSSPARPQPAGSLQFDPAPGMPADQPIALKLVQKPGQQPPPDSFPARAKILETSGFVYLRCGVQSDGSLVNCKVTLEAHPNLGFAEAALKQAALMMLKREDGQPMPSGRTITFSVNFDLQ